ncbi:MAG: hypothetical protein GY906_23540 [bacterium]|nr:hypothetical protein [bacterium]
MTKQGDQPPSNFDARADSAALALRQSLQGQGRQMPDTAPVEVGPDGQPPASLPPEGSYARQSVELQRRAEQAAVQPADPAVDGSMEPRLPSPGQAPQQPNADATSPRAEQRIKELVDQLRLRDQELQQVREEGKVAGDTATQLQQRLQNLEEQHQQMLQANLENLDPETRMQVMQDARLSQRMDEMEQRLMGRIQPQLQDLNTQAARNEMQALGDNYPAFDYQIHSPLIDMFRRKNPHCTIDQAFRAIAEPDELVTRSVASASAVPPTIAPGNGELAAARFAPQPEPQTTSPEDELVADARRIAKLRRSTDPAEQKEGMALIDQNLKQRLGG